MRCFPKSRRQINTRERYTDQSLSVDVVFKDSLTPEGGGSIRCVVRGGSGEYYLEWTHEGTSALLTLNEERNEASNVPPGTYDVSIRDRNTNCETSTSVTINLAKIPTVSGYAVTHASGDTARDGMIIAQLQNVQTNRYLWTSGVITSTPELLDVRPGTYTVAPMSTNNIPINFFHACEPAIVHASKTQLLNK